MAETYDLTGTLYRTRSGRQQGQGTHDIVVILNVMAVWMGAVHMGKQHYATYYGKSGSQCPPEQVNEIYTWRE